MLQHKFLSHWTRLNGPASLDPPHWTRSVPDWLNEKFPDRWMGHGSPNMQWAPHSPNLSVCDFFLWGFIKSKVYTTRPRDIPELKERIVNAFGEITREIRQKTLLEYRKRLEKVIENDGAHVEVHKS